MDIGGFIAEMESVAGQSGGMDIVLYKDIMFSVETVSDVVLGIMLALLTIGSTLILFLEVAFINIPPFTAFLIEREDLHTEKGKRHFGISLNTAYEAVMESMRTGENRNFIYLKSRMKAIIIVAIVMMLLTLGTDLVVELVLRVADPIVKNLI